MGLIMSLGGGGLSLEQPSYTVIDKCNGYEVRRYDARVLAVAEAEVDASQPDQKDSALFSTLASYIGVRGPAMNSEGRSIKMTAPVLTDLGDKPPPGIRTIKKSMAFVLPRFFQSVEQAPKPTNPRVRLLKLPSRTVAVHRFSGQTSITDSKRRAEMLMSSLKLHQLAPAHGMERRGLGMMLDSNSMHVVSVMPDSVASIAGITTGDQIKEVNGISVASPQELASAVRTVSGDSVVMLTKSGSQEHHYVVFEGIEGAEPASMLQNTGPLALSSKWTLARYDPPFVPAAMRTNEILIPLDINQEVVGGRRTTGGTTGEDSPPALAERSGRGGNTRNEEDERVCTLIRAALASGVPMYNGGDAEGCARVYEKCCRNLLQVEGLDEDARESARKVLQENEGEGKQQPSAESRAWALRHVLDHTLSTVKQQQAFPKPAGDIGGCLPSSAEGGRDVEHLPPSKSARPVFYMSMAQDLTSGKIISLHIFEPRYKVLVQEALARADRTFIYTSQRPQEGQPGWIVEILSASVDDVDGSADIKGRVSVPVHLTGVFSRDDAQSSVEDTLFWADGM